MTELLPVLLFPILAAAVSTIAAVADVRTGTIPDRLTRGALGQFCAFIAATLHALIRTAWQGGMRRTVGNALALSANVFLPKVKRRTVPVESLTPLRLGPSVVAGVVVAWLAVWSGR